MFFVLPIGTDRRLKRTPWVNYTLIAVNALIFLFTTATMRPDAPSAFYYRMMLSPISPELQQFLTYQFMHAGWQHILGNMLFLYVFGNSVEDRFGRVGYLFFYLAGGVIAGLGHALTDWAPVLGASGSVAAVSGAYMALFPRSDVTLFFWILFRFGTFVVSGLVLILFYIASDLLRAIAGLVEVAYSAHLAGYAFGFAVGMLLLWLRVLPREPYDLLALWTHYRRRREFRRLSQRGFKPWEKEAAGGVGHDGSDASSPRSQAVMASRQQISEAVAANELKKAATLYVKLLATDDQQVMSQQHQLDIANQLMNDGQHEDAARAYELLLSKYPRYSQRAQAELVLALIYTRYLHRRERARELLQSALSRLDDEDQKDIARRMLQEVGG